MPGAAEAGRARKTWDLGHGVRVQRKGEELRVFSRELSLGWSGSSPGFPGTAVDFDGSFWEAYLLNSAAGGELWRLEPWPDGEVLRHTEVLSTGTVDALSRREIESAHHEGVGWVLLLLSPLTGLLPAGIQEKIEVEWGLPGGRATFLSALPELLGAPIAVAVYHGSWDPPFPRPLAYLFSLYLFLEGFFRMGYGFGINRPLGSLLTLPLAFIFSARKTHARADRGVRGLSVRGMVTRSLLLGFAPTWVQEELSGLLGVGPRFFSFMTSGMEVVGGGIDLCRRGSDVFTLFSLFFLVEGCGRMVFIFLKGRPAGSLLGLPFAPLYRKWLREG